MNNRKVIINKICKLNRETIGSINQPDFINYLDTGNITRNKIDEIKKLYKGLDKYPSRAQRKVKFDTIIYSTVRPEQEHFGIIENSIENLIVSTGFTTLDIIDDSVDAKYLYYALTNRSITEYLNVIATNNVTSYPSLNPSDIGDLVFKIPNNKLEQQKIAKVLSDLDAKIELNNKINIELEAMAKTLYDYWFVQFDFPDTNGRPYKTSGGKMVWNEELKREIPEGWEVGTLDSIGDIMGGSTPSKAIDSNFCFALGTPWITPKDLSNNKGNKFITRGEFDVTERGIKEASLKIMPKGSVLLSSRAPIGYLAIARTGVTTNQGFKSFVPKSNFSSEYIYYTIQNCIPEIEANSSGSTFKEVSSSTLKTIKTILPANEILTSFYKIIKPIFRKQDFIELENQELASLRDWLLPMLMNGQVSVGKVTKEYQMEEDVLRMVAEPTIEFEEELSINDLNAAIGAIYYIENQKVGYAHVKTGIHKTLFLAKTAMKQNILSNLQFQRYFHGTFSKQVANAIDNNPFLVTERISKNREVFKLKQDRSEELINWMTNAENKAYVLAIQQLVDIYQHQIISNNIDKIELLNTVYKIMLDSNSAEFNIIWREMKKWPINKKNTEYKSDKFSEFETKEMIQFITKIGWFK